MPDRTCTIEGCSRVISARGWCSTHYVRWRKTGSTDKPTKPQRAACAIEGCGNEWRKRGWCEVHYRRWQRHGDPNAMLDNRVPLPDDCPDPTEVWRPVSGYEGRYEVSDHGRVRALDRVVIRTGRPTRLRGRILRGRPMKAGHLQVNLGRDGVSTNVLVHHLVLGAFIGPRPQGLEGCHNDGDPTNNRITNLRWDTRSSNCYDRVRHARERQIKETTDPCLSPPVQSCLT